MNTFVKIVVFISAIAFGKPALAQEKLNFTDTLGRKQGHWIKYNGEKKKVYDGNFKNDIPVGKFIYYLNTGEPWAITIFSEEGKVSHTQHLNKNGKISGEGKYINQQKDSVWKFYDDLGNLKSEESYLNGIKHGKSKVYYSNGQLAEDKGWVNGEIHGMYTKYFENGLIKSQREYIKGSVEGKARYNYPSGKIYAEGSYKNDVKDGVWKFYKEDGTIEKTITYINGKSKNHEDELIMTKEEEERLKKLYENSDSEVSPGEKK
jgi:antitoxin component YwqK of YwqJK toxin-antitoxin module